MNLEALTDDELAALRGEVEQEMRSRGIYFSVGEIGEMVAVKYFNSTPGLSNLRAAPTGVSNGGKST